MIKGNVFGSTWRTLFHSSREPIISAALTYPLSFTDMAADRIIREPPIPPGQERLGFLFQLLIVFVQFFKTVFPYLCVFICLLEFLLVFQLLRLFRKAADRIIL